MAKESFRRSGLRCGFRVHPLHTNHPSLNVIKKDSAKGESVTREALGSSPYSQEDTDSLAYEYK